MDLTGRTARIVGSGWPTRLARSKPGFAKPGKARPRRSRPCSACTGRGPTAPRFSSSTTPPPPRTSPRRPSSPQSAASTASIADGRSARGCTGSSSIAQSTGRGPASSGARRAWRRPRRPDHAAELSDETLAALAALTPEHRAVIVLRYVLGYSPGEIAGLLDLPRGTVNSRLRRGLDTLSERLRS